MEKLAGSDRIREKSEEDQGCCLGGIIIIIIAPIGAEALEAYNMFQWDEQQDGENNTLIIETFYKPKKNLTYQCYVPRTEKQKEEKLDDSM